MSMVSYDDRIGVAEVRAAEPGRRNVLLVGAIVACAAGAVVLGTLLAGYLHARDLAKDANQAWPPDGTTIPNVALFTIVVGLAISSFTAQWAHAAIKMDERRQAYLAVGSTIAIGLLFVNGMSFSWDRLGLEAGSGAYADSVLALTVVHVLVVVAAIAVWFVMGFRVFGGHFSPRNSEFIAAAVVVWHFVVASGIVIWWALWFVEGGPG
jgi:heme/copper-type cytochrome/quinol oxidase subunit 3